MPNQREQQQQQALSAPPPCPGCHRTMRLVGRESSPGIAGVEIFTFECECGHVDVTRTNL